MLSLQYHRQKDETLLVVKGAMDLQLEDDRGQLQTHRLTPGMSRRIIPGRKHRMIGVEECEVFKVSSPEIDDVVRLEDKYARQGTSTGCLTFPHFPPTLRRPSILFFAIDTPSS